MAMVLQGEDRWCSAGSCKSSSSGGPGKVVYCWNACVFVELCGCPSVMADVFVATTWTGDEESDMKEWPPLKVEIQASRNPRTDNKAKPRCLGWFFPKKRH